MKKIKMQLFGSFILEDGERTLGEEVLRSAKLTRLLVYILMNRDCVLTHQNLIEVVGEDDSKCPEGVLKNLMYRIRKIMKELGDEKYICTMSGAYRWNPEIEVETDYEQFEYLSEQLPTANTTEEKKKICREMISCYKNNVSAKVASETWMLPKVVWYQSSYMEAVKTLCRICEEEREWSELELNCKKAMLTDPLDEDIHCWLMKSLHGQKKYDQAIQQYEKAKKIFYENMGIRSPKKLKEEFERLLADTGEEVTDITGFLKETREQEKPKGVFFCDYQIFRQIYRIESRRVDRLGVAEHLMLLTLRKRGAAWQEKITDRIQAEAMEAFEEAIRLSLRAGDVAARYSSSQYVILLPMCTYESGIKVAERIQENFRKKMGKRGLELTWELSEISSANVVE